MSYHLSRPSISATCALLVAAMMVASGCGRSPVDPTAGGTSPDPAASKAPADPGAPDVSPDPSAGGGTSPGDTPSGPATAAPGGGGTKPAPKGGLKPLVRPTAPPAFKFAPAPAGPAGTSDTFAALLTNFGYQPPANSGENVQMQLTVIVHVPADHPDLMHWSDDPNLLAKYNFHITNPLEDWPPGTTFDQWQKMGADLAVRTQNFSMYVARSTLYRNLLSNRYHDSPDQLPLIFYKRMNRMQYAVTYTPDGAIDDFCAYKMITVAGNLQLFMALPAVMYQ